jgi:hypothetical protein
VIKPYLTNAELDEHKKKNTKRVDIKKILAYSAIKIKANPADPYSILNPDTSSDSPSAKSKGVRLVSAKQEINHIPTSGGNKKTFCQNKFIATASEKLRVLDKLIKNRIIKAKLTS